MNTHYSNHNSKGLNKNDAKIVDIIIYKLLTFGTNSNITIPICNYHSFLYEEVYGDHLEEPNNYVNNMLQIINENMALLGLEKTLTPDNNISKNKLVYIFVDPYNIKYRVIFYLYGSTSMIMHPLPLSLTSFYTKPNINLINNILKSLCIGKN